MARIVIGIGANLSPEANIRRGLELLAEHTRVLAISTFYRSPALARPEQADYLNGAAALETALSPADLKALLRAIEHALGRQRTPDKLAARPIDLDVLVFGRELVAPREELLARPFVALPLAQLAPELVLPGAGRLGDLPSRFEGHGMEELPELASELRRALGLEREEGAQAP